MVTRFQDFLVATGGALLFLLMGWSWCRAVRRGRPLSSCQRKMLVYGFLFILGQAYLMMLGSWLGTPHALVFALIAAWGLFLAVVAWWRHRRKQAASQPAGHGP